MCKMAVFIELQHNAIDILKNKNITIAIDGDKHYTLRPNHVGPLWKASLGKGYHWTVVGSICMQTHLCCQEGGKRQIKIQG